MSKLITTIVFLRSGGGQFIDFLVSSSYIERWVYTKENQNVRMCNEGTTKKGNNQKWSIAYFKRNGPLLLNMKINVEVVDI